MDENSHNFNIYVDTILNYFGGLHKFLCSFESDFEIFTCFGYLRYVVRESKDQRSKFFGSKFKNP